MNNVNSGEHLPPTPSGDELDQERGILENPQGGPVAITYMKGNEVIHYRFISREEFYRWHETHPGQVIEEIDAEES